MGCQVALEFHRRNANLAIALVLMLGAAGQSLETFAESRYSKHIFHLIHRTINKIGPKSNYITRALLKSRAAWPFTQKMALVDPSTSTNPLDLSEDDMIEKTAQVLADGKAVGWFQGRMEFGPRALGGRSILGCPSSPGVAGRINEQIKFRERWRPFCPSMLDRVAPKMFATSHPAPFMTFTFKVEDDWKSRVPEVVHEDGTARAQALKKDSHPRYYALMEEMEKLTGNGVVLNTSLNRRGEPMVCSPKDALDMFSGSDLQYLIMEDVLVAKDASKLKLLS